MNVVQTLGDLSIGRDDDVAIAFAPTISPRAAARAAERIARRLDDAGAPRNQRIWIAAAGGDQQMARLASAIAGAIGDSALILHDPRDLDGLIFQRRVPGQRRGGIYLNAAWQTASVRIAVGAALDLVDGLSGWFNRCASLRADDLHAALRIEEPLS